MNTILILAALCQIHHAPSAFKKCRNDLITCEAKKLNQAFKDHQLKYEQSLWEMYKCNNTKVMNTIYCSEVVWDFQHDIPENFWDDSTKRFEACAKQKGLI